MGKKMEDEIEAGVIRGFILGERSIFVTPSPKIETLL